MGNDDPPAHLGYMTDTAAGTASALEVAKEVWPTALAVDDLVVNTAQQGWGDLTAAMAREVMHLRAAGRAADAQPFLVRPPNVRRGRGEGHAWATALLVIARVSRLIGSDAVQNDVRAAIARFNETAIAVEEPRLRSAVDRRRTETAS